MVTVWWFALFSRHFDSVKLVKFGIYGHFMKGMTWDSACWCILSTFRTDYILLIFLILMAFWLSKTGQILGFRAFPGERMKGMTWNFACWCILTTFRTQTVLVMICWFLAATNSSMNGSVCLSVRLSLLFHYVPNIVSSWNFQKLLPWTKVMSMQEDQVRGQRSRSQRSKQILDQIERFRTVTAVGIH